MKLVGGDDLVELQTNILEEEGTEGLNMRWNSTVQEWINSEDSIIEVSCIHTTQGYYFWQ